MKSVVPSVLTKDYDELERKIRILEKLTDVIQIDIMDGELVPNISIGADEVKKVNPKSKLEIHLMVKNPKAYIKPFANIGAFRAIFHIESDDDPLEVIEEIKKYNMEPGIAINPPTPLEKILPFLEFINVVLVMGVNPGFQGQKFIPETLDKVKAIKKIRPEILVELDGGVNPEIGPSLISAGVDILNVGSFLFKEGDVKENWGLMQRIIK
ncbi:MAG: ribulose-phosphate 3-epimerase [Candidatus Poribacteria bacterium]